MLTIICGEDTSASRKYFSDTINSYTKKGYYIDKINANEIESLTKGREDDLLLFNEKKLYVVEHLTQFTSKKRDKAFAAVLADIIANKEIEVIDWEEKGAREIKLKTTDIKEFKPSQTIFQLLEACYPGNLKGFVTLLHTVSELQEETFIFIMLSRHIRTLLLALTNTLPPSTPFWMKKNILAQAQKWNLDKLLNFYEGLARLDVSTKTSSNIYGVSGSIKLLACYFLK